MKFRSRVVEIEAVQLRADTWGEVRALALTSLHGAGVRRLSLGQVDLEFPGARDAEGPFEGNIYALIPTLEGNHLAREGDWIIRGTESELYPCRDSIFRRKYEEVP